MDNPLAKLQTSALKKVHDEAARGAKDAVMPIVKVSIGLSLLAIGLSVAAIAKKGRKRT